MAIDKFATADCQFYLRPAHSGAASAKTGDHFCPDSNGASSRGRLQGAAEAAYVLNLPDWGVASDHRRLVAGGK